MGNMGSPGAPPSPAGSAATSEQVHDDALQPHSQGLGAGEATGPTGQVPGRDAEAATGLSHQQVLTGPGEGEGQSIEGHIVRGARGLAPPTAPMPRAVPLPAPAHTVGKVGRCVTVTERT